MIEQGFNYADSTIKEMTDFFDNKAHNLESKEDRKNLQLLPRNQEIPKEKEKEKGRLQLQCRRVQ